MKKYLVTMGGYEQGKNRHNESFGIHRNYNAEALRLFDSGKPWFDEFRMGTNELIKLKYPNNKVLEEPSMGWAFKPICIYETMQNASDGDFIMWADSNHIITQTPQFFIDFALEYGWIFTWDHWGVRYPLRDWTHLDTFVNMGRVDKVYFDSPVMQVNIMGFIKSVTTEKIVKEWLDYCMDYNVMIRNDLPNLPGFVDHRHEQSIWSILRAKWGFMYYHRVDPAIEAIVPELDGIAL